MFQVPTRSGVRQIGYSVLELEETGRPIPNKSQPVVLTHFIMALTHGLFPGRPCGPVPEGFTVPFSASCPPGVSHQHTSWLCPGWWGSRIFMRSSFKETANAILKQGRIWHCCETARSPPHQKPCPSPPIPDPGMIQGCPNAITQWLDSWFATLQPPASIRTALAPQKSFWSGLPSHCHTDREVWVRTVTVLYWSDRISNPLVYNLGEVVLIHLVMTKTKEKCCFNIIIKGSGSGCHHLICSV